MPQKLYNRFRKICYFARSAVAIILLCGLLSWPHNALALGEDSKISVTLALKGFETHLLIPESYLATKIINGYPLGDPHEYLMLQAMLPNFDPLPPEARKLNPDFKASTFEAVMQSGNFISIWIGQGLSDGVVKTIKYEVDHDVRLPPDPDFLGFDIYTIKAASGTNEDPHFKFRILIPSNPPASQEVYIELVKQDLQTSQRRLYFTEHTALPHLLFGQFTISHSKLANYMVLRQRCLDFISGLLVNPANEKPL